MRKHLVIGVALLGLTVGILAARSTKADEEVLVDSDTDSEKDLEAAEFVADEIPLAKAPDSAVDPKEAIADHAQYLSEAQLKLSRPWNAPNYSSQTGALGWNESVFAIPSDLKSRVDFWREIYTKYSTDQGVLHDTRSLIVYEPIDFKAITGDPNLTLKEKRTRKERALRSKKDEITARLYRLSIQFAATGKPDGLTGEDLRYWHLFDGIESKEKFRDAAGKKRVRFQLGQKDKFYIGLYHSGRYLTEMETIFRKEGLPIELTRLPFVESSFNIHARSRVGASGIWQFMRRTAKPYMKVTAQIDERNDPLKATRASARMLRGNYQMLDSWPLALTGYNHGPSGVKRIVEKVGSRDLGRIIDVYSSKTFGFASENFYACFLAALDAEKNAKLYFSDPRWGPPLKSVEVPVSRNMNYKTLLDMFAGDQDLAETFNPHLSAGVRAGKKFIPAKTYIRVPAGSADEAAHLKPGAAPVMNDFSSSRHTEVSGDR